jgi:glycosyltransferase involved in cell wall biosynthesis
MAREQLGHPLVSIVIPNYNYAAYLAEAISSALAQDYPVTEVIVVDDGSKDDSLTVARRFPVQVVAQRNRGLSAARNAGAERADGEYLVFLDADDTLPRDYVSCTLHALQALPPAVAFAYTPVQHFGDDVRRVEPPAFSVRAMVRNNLAHASSLIRADAFRRVGGYDETWQTAFEDHELWLRLLSSGYQGVLVPEVALNYRQHGPSMSRITSREKWDAVRWRIRLRYPRFYWQKILVHPFRAVKWAWHLWRSPPRAR